MISLDVITVEHRTVVSTITLRREGEAITRVMRECTHEALQCLPHIRCRALSRVWNETNIRFGVCAACADFFGVIGACFARQLDDIASAILIPWDWNRV